MAGASGLRVPDTEGDLDGLAGQRDAADPRGWGRTSLASWGSTARRAGRDVAGVACFQLVVQALHQLIRAPAVTCLYTRILNLE